MLRSESFARTLLLELNDDSIKSLSSPIQIFACERLKARFLKKFIFDESIDHLHNKAIRDFIEINDSIDASQVFPDSSILGSPDNFVVSCASDFIHRTLFKANGSSDLEIGDVISNWRLGPGTSNGVKGSHFVDKVSHPFTVTERAEPFAKLLRALTPSLASYDSKQKIGVKRVSGSKMTTVPKDKDKRRTICCEPSGNMALQLGCAVLIEKALQHIGLDISRQPSYNSFLARVGSTNGDLATLDLKSASDMITPRLIELLWPRSWYTFFMCCRSDYTSVQFKGEVGNLISNQIVKLNMMSTMGNGFTFPMMTLTIAALLYAVNEQHKSQPFSTKIRKDLDVEETFLYAVFGDDVIVKTIYFDSVCSILHRAGLIVNVEKSFHTGFFRESCGGDYYHGQNVTPFYVKSLTTQQDVYVAINQLLDWCGRVGIELTKTLSLLLHFAREYGPLFFVPEWDADTSGIRNSVVSKRYRRFAESKKFKICNNHPLALFCIVGGYVSSHERGTFKYMPRREPVYVIEVVRMPKGFLSGADYLGRSVDARKLIQTMLYMEHEPEGCVPVM